MARRRYHLDRRDIHAQRFDRRCDDREQIVRCSIYYGFGAGTGGATNDQRVRILEMTSTVPVDYLSVAHDAAAGTIIGGLQGIDPNVGDTFTYSIVDTNGQAVADPIFEIVNGDELAVKANAVYDDPSVTSHTLNILVTDAAGATYETSVTIQYDVPVGPAAAVPVPQTILGTTGNDLIIGSNGNSSLSGGYGNDTIRGGDDPLLNYGNDTFDGGPGDDVLYGGRGDDTYIFDRGDGNDTIYESGGDNTIDFGAGIAKSDIVVSQVNGTDIRLTLDNGDGSITIKNGLGGDLSAAIQHFVFADGTSWQWADVVAMSQQGGAGDDVVQAVMLPVDDPAVNLVYNGGFENFTPGAYAWLAAQDVPGWVDANGNPIYIGSNSSGWFGAGDGAYSLNLNNYGVASDISQQIANLTAGEALLLQFDHAGYYGSLEVYWNDQLVDTVTDNRPAIATDDLFVTAQDGVNTLRFEDISQGYSAGQEAIDNVQLYSFGSQAPVYADGTAVQNGDVLANPGTSQAGVLYDAVEASAAATAPNLIVNGTFQTPDPLSDGSVSTSNVPGWMDANATPFQIESSTTVPAQDGQYLYVDDGTTDMDISQTIGNLSSGQTLLLRFDYAAQYNTTGSFNVYWNGDLVATVDAADQSFRTDSYLVEAQAGDNVLRFASVDPAPGGSFFQFVALTNLSLQAVDPGSIAAVPRLSADPSAPSGPLSGGDGNDTLTGSAGNDTIIGGKGDDLLEGGAGDDTYLFNLGDGQDTIVDTQGYNKLVFGDGIATADVWMLKNGTNVTLAIAGTGDQVVIGTPPDSGDAPALSIQEVDFADGSVWTADTLAAMEQDGSDGNQIVQGDNAGDLLTAGPDDATVLGGGGDDTLLSGPGNDLLEGGQGDDTYVVGSGSGQTVIDDAGGFNDTLSFDASVAPADVSVQESSDGANLIFTIAGTATRVEIENAWGSGRIENIVFADGTSWSTQDIITRLATPGNDIVIGDGSGNETLQGGPGNDYLSSGGGSDNTYIFNYGDGQDTIGGTSANSNDTLEISGYSQDEVTFSRLAVGSSDVIVSFANTSDQILLENELDNTGVESVQLTDDGTVYTVDDIRTAVLAAESTDGDNTIIGTDGGNETIDGGTGNDLIISGTSNETFLYRQGDGDDRIVLSAPDGHGDGTKTLDLLDYSASDLSSVSRASAQSDDLVLTFKNSGDRITLVSALGENNDTYYTFTISFQDGTVWTRDDMRQQVINFADTTGNDIVDGDFDSYSWGNGSRGVTFNGNSGDDQLIGGGQGDTFIFAKGDGNDTITENNTNGYGNTVQFVGINSTDVSAAWEYKGSSTVVLSYLGDSADSVTIVNALATDGSGIQTYQFADGVTWDKTALRARLSNAPPVATDDGYFSAVAGQADSISVATLLSNDFDPNGDTISIVSVDGGAEGTASLDGQGNVLYTANTGFVGATTFQYTITDGNGGFATASVNVRVRPPAAAVDDTGFTVAEDGSLNISAARLLSNDPGGEDNVVGSVLDPVHGTVSLSSNGNILFTPDQYYRGAAQFSYIDNTPDGGAAQANVYITVTPVDHNPIAVNDGPLQTLENQAFTIDPTTLLANDSDVDNNPFTLTSVTSSADLRVVLNADGTITATPSDYFYGSTFFEYTITGPSGLSSTASVAVTVTKRSLPPVAVNDLISTFHDAPILENSPIVVDASQLLANDTDFQNYPLTVVSVDNAIGGSATLLENATVLFIPNANFNGNARFDYTISDGNGNSATATATVVYQPVNQPPVAQDDSYQSNDPELQRALQGQENVPLSIAITELLKNDYDIEPDTITFQSAGNADHGTLTISGDPATALDAGGDVALTPNSTITYTPDAGYYGDAFFSYVISDPQGAIGAGRVTVNFAPDQADAPPIANPDSFTLFEDIPVTIDISTLLSNDASADGGPLTFVGWYQDPYNPLIGSIKTDDNGNLVYTPYLNWFGDTHFFYTIEDDNGHTASAEVDLTVLNVPHDPTAVDLDGFVTPLDIPLVIPVAGILKQDYSVDDFTAPGVWLQPDPNLSFVGVDAVDHGQASVVTANGEQYIVVTEDPGYTGPIKITYRIADVDGLRGIGFLNATVESSYSGELDGTEGNDLLIGNNTNEIIRTFDGTDTVLTGDGNNTVYLGSGNDTVTTGAGDDVVYAGTGNSVISTGGGNDTIYEAAGADQIDGGAGFNAVDYSASHTGVNVDLEARIGRLGDAEGDIYRDIQSVVGSKYDDTLRADDNGDQLSGGDGNDLLIGGAGADTLLGGAGDDTLVGSAGADVMDGGTGNNTADYSGSNAAVSVDLAAGTASGGYADGDTLLNIQNVIGSAYDDLLIGDDKGDLLVGGDGNDTLEGGAGNDTLVGGAGADVLDGGDGINTVDYSDSSAGVQINLAAGTASGGDAEGDTLISIQNLIGSNYDDVLIGDDSNNVFIGGAGADTIDGGGGINTASYATSNAAVSVNLETGLGSGGDAEGDVLRNIQVLIGSNYNDTLIGSDGNDTLRGGAGNDTLEGGAGSDTYLFGLGDGADTIIETASATNVNSIVLDPDITVHDVSVEQVGNDMVLVFENQGEFLTDSITVKDQFLDADSGIQQVVFADGTIWDRNTLALHSLEGVLNAQDDVFYGVEEATSVIDPMSLFTNDVTGSTAGLTLLSVQDAVNGTVSIDANGKIEFTGDPLYHGDAYFTYTVADPYGRQSTARVQVNLASTNHPPVAIDHTGLTGLEDTVLKIPFSVLLQGATDPENDPLTVVDGAPLLDDNGNPITPYKSQQDSFAGTNVGGSFGNNAVLGDYVQLDIAPDYYGFAGFQYEVSDGNGGFDWANEEIYIDHVNQAPRAGDKDVEKFTIRLGEVNVLTLSQLLASAYDPEGDPFHFVGIHDAVSGTASYDPTAASVSFTAAALGQASFQFDLADIYNAQSTITVDLTVIPEFDPPIARDDSGFVGLENQALVIDPALLLANDSDPNGDTIILRSVGRFAQDGYVSINSAGQIVFIPRTNYNGAASFTYQITDSHGGVAQATVSLTINPVDLGATLHDDIVEDVQDQPLTILPAEAFGNDVDPLGNVLFFGGATVLGQLATKYLSRDVQFSALTVRGKALPDWLSFDASTMTFTGVMPAGTTSIDVEVKTFDPDNGNSFVHYFRFTSADAAGLVTGISVEDKVMAGYTIRGDFAESFDYGWTGVGQTVSVSVTLADGSALPAWLAFDPATLTLVGAAPAGTVPFAVLATYSYLDPTSGATLLLRRDVVVDPATVSAGIELNAHVATLALGTGTWDAHMAGNQPLPEWLDFDPNAHTLAFSDFAPAPGTAPARIDIDFTPTPVALPNGTYASSQGGFTLEFVIDPNAPLDPAIDTILANSAYFADQNEFGIDLAHAASVTALLADGNPLPAWLSFDPSTLRFSGSPPPEFVGAIPVRLDVVGNGLDTPDFSIMTDVVVDSTFQTLQQNAPTSTVAPDLVTLYSPVAHDNGSIAVQYTTVDEKGTASDNAATDVVNIAPRLVPIRTQDASYGLVQGHGVSFTLDDVLANDRDDNGDPFRVISFTQPADGTLVETGAHYDLAPPASLIATAASSFSATLADGTALPDWMTLDPTTGVISAHPPIDVLGTYTVQYTLTDGASTQTAQATYAIDGNQGVGFTYTPDPSYYGDDGITYTVTDDKQAPVTANVALHVAPALVANNDEFSLTSDSSITIGIASLLANDVSADDRPLTVTSVTPASAGSLTFDGSNIIYDSTHYYDGTATFDYTVADDQGHSQTALVTLDITSTDHAPIANPIVLEGQESVPVTVSLADILSHVVDPDGDPVQLVSITPDAGTQARALVLPDGGTQFVPDAYKYGDMLFSYVVTDGYKSSTGSIDVDFAKVPQPPIANTDGVYQDNENTPYRVSLDTLLANDVDPDGTALSITSVYRGVNGSVAIDGTDAVFTPRTGYYGTASFNYTLTNAEGEQSQGLVNFLILPVDNPPIAVSDSGFTTLEDTPLDIDPAQLLANDIDPDGKGLTFLGFTDGNVTELPNGLYQVTPPYNFSGPLVLDYAITNDSSIVVTTTVTIDVQHVEHAPTAVDDNFAMTEDQPLVLQEQQLLANDSDRDNEAFGLTSIVDTSHVSVALDPTTGQLTVTPDLHFNGAAWFDYQITASNGLTDTARVNLDVAFVYYPPTIADIAPLSATEDQPFSIALPAGVVTDIENYPLLITLQAPGGGALPDWLSFDSNSQTLSGTPPTGVFGDVTLELRADDGQGVATKDFTLAIAPVNPSVNDGASTETGLITELPGTTGSLVQDSVAGSIAFDDPDSADIHTGSVTGVTISGHGGGLPADSALLTFLTLGGVTEPAGGQPGLQPWTFSAADQTFDYLAAGETVTLTYALRISDGAGGVTTTNVSVTVTGTNDAPIAANESAATPQNDPVTQAFAGTDPDEGDVLTYQLRGAPVLGTVTNNADGTFTFDPGHAFDALAAGETQVVTFTYQATDKANAISNAGTVSVTVTGVNDPPVTDMIAAQIVPTGVATAIPGIRTYDIDHGAVSTVTLTATYGTLAATSISGGTISGDNTGVLTLSGTPSIVTDMLASLTYTGAGYLSDSIAVVTSDGIATVDNGSIPVTVDPGPTLTPSVPAKVGHGQTVQVATVVPGLPGDTETLAITQAGRVRLTLANGVVSYAAPDTGGPDTIAYKVIDEYGDAASGTVNLTVDGGPITAAGTLTLGRGQSTDVTSLIDSLIAPGLPGDTETLLVVAATRGTASFQNGVVSYVAPLSGTDTIGYGVKDQLGDVAVGTIAVTVDPGPVLTSTAPAKIGSGQTVQVATVAPGLAGDTSTLTVTQSGRGTLSFANGVVSYTAPATGGADAIAWQVADQYGDVTSSTLNLSVYDLAEPIVSGTTLNLGAARVGGPLPTQTLAIANGPASDPYHESLIYALQAAPTGYAVTNGQGTILSGASATPSISLSTATAGVFNGETETLTLTSTGAGTSGLPDTALDSETITLNGKIYAKAAATESATSLNFGIVHAGATDIQTLSVTNTATGALTDVLTGGIGVISGGGFSGSGTLGTGVAAGVSSSALSLVLNTSTSGIFNATALLALASHDADQADVPVSAAPIALSGTVYNYATAGVTDTNTGTLTGSGNIYALNLGTLTQGAALTTAVVSLANFAAGLADTLSGTVAVSGGTSAFVNSGFGPVGTLAAGQSSGPLDISLRTGTTGVFTETVTFTPVSADPGGSTNLAPVTIAVTGTVSPPAGTVYTLTSGVDTVNGDAGVNTVLATGGALSAGDTITAGSGASNTLILQGTGIFNLGLPATLTGISTIQAQEGQPSAVVNGVAYTSTLQIVTLRAGENNVTVNVQPGTPNPANPSASAITINGAANNDVINLGSGNDTVTPGAGETVNGGSGNAAVVISAATISDVVNGGSGTTKLWFTGGGTYALGANFSNPTSVYLASASTAWNVTATSTPGLVMQDGSTSTLDHLTANGANQTLTGGGAGKLTMQGALDTTFADTAALINGDTLGFAAGDLIDITNLLPSGLALAFAENGQNTGGTLTVLSNGVQKAAITLNGGIFNQSHFGVGSDGGTGAAINYHP
jgi:Ca2+-binding RTX toxin-like protein